jgi:predicted nucleic acid-binding protein
MNMPTSNSVIFDSNVWIALMNSKDSLHEQALGVFTVFRTSSIFVVPSLVDSECATVLLRSGFVSSKQWFYFRMESENFSLLQFSQQDHLLTVDLFLQLQNPKLSFVDISLLYLSQQGYTIMTFDKQLQKALDAS